MTWPGLLPALLPLRIWALEPQPAAPEAVWVLGFDDALSPEEAEGLASRWGEVQAVAALRGSPSGPLVQLRSAASPAELSRLPGVLSVDPPIYAHPKQVQGEGVDELFVEQDWPALGLTGRGVRVGVLDVGFWGAADLAGTELPADLTVLGGGGSSVHGTAAAELLVDIAPEVDLRLYRLGTAVEFIAALEEARRDRVEVVSASVGFDNVWAADGSSPMSQAVDEAQDDGVVVVLPAGNEVGRYWQGALADADGDGWLEIGGEEVVRIAALGADAGATLRWDEPFGGARLDLALVLVDERGRECGRGDRTQDGDDTPLETASCPEPEVWVGVQGDPEALGLQAWLYAPGGVLELEPTQASTLTLPADARGGLCVGAYRVSTEELEGFSSWGPTEDGRAKPDLAAASGVSTASLGDRGFYGSSAAAPQVAGLAALALDADPGLDPEALRALLVAQAVDRGAPGWDAGWGAGAARAGAPPQRCGCTQGDAGGSAVPAGFAAILLRRARRRAKLAGPGPTL